MTREPTEMELRVAKALLDDNLRQINENDRKRYGADYREMIDTRGWDGQDDHVKRMYLSYARAAIRAMREPTTEMLRDALIGMPVRTEPAAAIWEVLIDAASPEEG